MYSQRLLDHYQQPRNEGRLADPVPGALPGEILAAEEYNPLCGDRVTVRIRVFEGRIEEAGFDGRGCALCLGAASLLTEMILGRTTDELQPLKADAFLAELGVTVRPARLKCALLPWVAFRHAAFGEAEWPL